MHRAARAECRQLQRGLTLVELLVAMLIMGFVLTLVSQAIYQVAQVARSAQQVTERLSAHWAGGRAAEPVIANLVVPSEVPLGKAFTGGPAELAGYSLQPPFGSDAGVRAFRFELRSARDDANRSELLAGASDDPGARPAVIAIFDARAEFAYANEDGRTSTVWPAAAMASSAVTSELPRAVLVRERSSGRILMWYGFPGDPSRPNPPPNPFGSSR